jgi:hypothetical protein
MIGPSPANPPRLSNCDLPFSYPIPSRDIAPLGASGAGNALQTPADATIMVVDRDGGGAPGVFVSIRVDMEDVPEAIRDRLENFNVVSDPFNRFGNIDPDQGGSIHIGYSHLTIGSIPQNIEPVDIRNGITPNLVIPAGTIIGYSGDTGNTFGPHLDIAAFYVPDQPDVANAIRFEGYANPVFADFRHNWDAYWTMYDETRKKPDQSFGPPIVINPLVLWPYLQEGTNCSFEGGGPS